MLKLDSIRLIYKLTSNWSFKKHGSRIQSFPIPVITLRPYLFKSKYGLIHVNPHVGRVILCHLDLTLCWINFCSDLLLVRFVPFAAAGSCSSTLNCGFRSAHLVLLYLEPAICSLQLQNFSLVQFSNFHLFLISLACFPRKRRENIGILLFLLKSCLFEL